MTRNMIKVGRRIERIDLYGRLHHTQKELIRQVTRLIPRVERSGLAYDRDNLMLLKSIVEEPEIDYYKVVSVAESIV